MSEQNKLFLSRKPNIKIVTKSNFTDALIDIQEHKAISFDCETSGLDPWAPGGYITSLGISTKTTDWCFPLNHHQSPIKEDDTAQLKIIKNLDKILVDKILVAHNGKFDHLWLRQIYGVKWYPGFDTMLAHYNLDENDWHGLKELTVKYGWDNGYDIPLEEKQGKVGSLKRHCEYLGKDCFYTLNLYYKFKRELKEDFGSSTVFYNITMPASDLYCDAQFKGIYIDKSKLADAKLYWAEKMNSSKAGLDKYYSKMPEAFYEEKITAAYQKKNGKYPDKEELNKLLKKAVNKGWKNKITGKKEFGINWGSPQQLGYILFEEEGIKPLKSTPKGADSTDESTLLQLSKKHKIPKLVLEYREATKNINTFIDGWATKLHNSRVHPNFKIGGTVTGRPSCEEPNLQQTPRDPRIRSLITAPPGKVLVDIDYSQAELRIVAEVSNDHALSLAYQTGVDVHGLTVENLFGIPRDKQTKEERKKGKAINFGFAYGMWHKKFTQYALDNYDTVFTPAESEKIRKDFFRLYKLEPWHKKQKEFAMKNGYVRNILGRKRRLQEAQLPDSGKYNRNREEALRQAINSPIQSFASDLTLMSAIEMANTFSEDDLCIVGTVHDSILMECNPKKLHIICPKLLDIMKYPRLLKDLEIELKIPLEGEIEIGPWGAGKLWKP